MDQDLFDIVSDEWARERPDLDTAGLEVVGRILLVAKHLRQSAGRKLAKCGLNLRAYEVLSTLRRQGAPYRLSPSELSEAAMLSSGAMTNRLDRLEASNWVRRTRDPNDRRGVLIELTAQGLELADQAITVRFREAAEAVAALGEAERQTIAHLLRKLLASYEKPKGHPESSKEGSTSFPA